MLKTCRRQAELFPLRVLYSSHTRPLKEPMDAKKPRLSGAETATDKGVLSTAADFARYLALPSIARRFPHAAAELLFRSFGITFDLPQLRFCFTLDGSDFV